MFAFTTHTLPNGEDQPKMKYGWLYNTTAKEKEDFLRTLENPMAEYISFINYNIIYIRNDYYKFLNQLKIRNLLHTDYKGKLYIPQDEQEYNLLTEGANMDFLKILLTYRDELNIKLRSYNYINLLRNFSGYDLKQVLLEVESQEEINEFDIKTFLMLFEELQKIKPEIKLSDIFETPHDISKQFYHCDSLNDIIKKHFNLREISINKTFGISGYNYPFPIIENYCQAFSQVYKGFCSDRSYVFIANDDEVQQMFIKNGKELLNDYYNGLSDFYKSCEGRILGDWEITKVVLNYDKINKNMPDIAKLHYKSKNGETYSSDIHDWNFKNLKTHEDILDFINAEVKNKIKYQNKKL